MENGTQIQAKPAGVEELDRVRDILFGAASRAYENRIGTLETEIHQLQQALAQLNVQVNDQQAAQLARVDDLRREWQETTQQLAEAKLDRAVLGDLLVALGNQLKATTPTSKDQ